MNPYSAGPFLEKIEIPADLREKFQPYELKQVCDELRQYIIDVVSEKGGHFGASLGVVELTVALHYVFNTPYDNLVWDVGHQAYGHKILTGRRAQFHTNRKYKGLSGFPKRAESEYDTFGVGHSSTSVSAGLGMAVGSRLNKEDEKHNVAIIGDGAMTAGMAFEGLNHAGIEDSNMLVILNDNCMSIDPPVGALKEYLTDITTSHTYNKVKDQVWDLLGQMSKFGPNAQSIVQKVEKAIKSAVINQSNLFESLNFRYFGPVDGHDVEYLQKVLRDLKDIKGPKLLHVVTRKGAGYEPAEVGSATKWHAPGLFDKETGAQMASSDNDPKPPKFQDVFGKSIIELAKADNRIVGVTPAMLTGSSLGMMMEVMPERTFDVGIAEQHAVTFSAGMATEGLIPFCNIYSSFMQRAYDQVIHDVTLQNLHVVFCLDRGGLVGADGPTHHGVFDLAYMRTLPNMVVGAPMNEPELRHMMYTASMEYKGPFTIRYPRGTGSVVDWQVPFEKMDVGTGRRLKNGEDVAVLSIGAIGTEAEKAVERLEKKGVKAGHYDMRFVKPLDDLLLHEVFSKYKIVVTVEDGCVQGGFGSAVLEWMSDQGYLSIVKRLGVPDRWIEHGTQAELYQECGYDVAAIEEAVLELVTSLEAPSGSARASA
ncbi:MAG: 1-deoxy-D-xylulose-5-phosphate synthase [Crocinitomicaceae bacterium]|nr:1-deoxy-D-xylulose-5-phosphate synthase [Crocinitomicaceae bacterium]|tara:strand:- start:21121 stop:23070 length:1950 start_codon:yes stop_codon:yes gene_type:complete